MAKKIEAKIMTIDPQMAQNWLAQKASNRSVNAPRVSALANEMTRGWTLNGEAIVLSAQGGVLDGQHRLSACVLSGKPFESVVVLNVPESVIHTLDTGRNRSVADVLAISGHKNTYGLSACMTIVASVCSRNLETALPVTIRTRPTIPQIVEFVRANPTLEKAFQDTQHQFFYVNGFQTYVSVLACLLARFGTAASYGRYRDFVQSLVSGTKMNDGDAAYIMRERIIKQRYWPSKTSARARLGLLIKAWNAHNTGLRIKLLNFKDNENFGKIHGIEDASPIYRQTIVQVGKDAK